MKWTRQILLWILLTLAATMALPLLIVKSYSAPKTAPNSSEADSGIDSETVTVYIADEDRVAEMEIGKYLKEVVAAEMPADFEEQALMAQAVAARTYTVSRQNAVRSGSVPEEHKGAELCTDSTHCKAWISEEKRRQSWGEAADANWQKISNAVDGTRNVIITYDGQPISAVFHSTSSGQTENARDVWGGAVPYLVSVESPGEELSPRYTSERELSLEDFERIFSEKKENADWSKEIVENVSRSAAGGIISMEVGGVGISGTEFRTIFELRSTNIQFDISDSTIKMSVTGNGHGVGMSQYGANYLASQGMNYCDILKTYYTGVEITKTQMSPHL